MTVKIELGDLSFTWRVPSRRRDSSSSRSVVTGLVFALARRYQRKGGSFVDVVAEANMGLMYAASKFDPQFGTRFATYAQYWVRVYASRCAIRAGATIPGSRSSAKVQREHARAQRLLGPGREAIELAAFNLGYSVEDVENSLLLTQRRNVSFEALGADLHGAADPLLFARGPSPEQAVVEKCEARRTQQVVQSAISTLSARETSHRREPPNGGTRCYRYARAAGG